MYHNKIDTSTTGEFIIELQNYECSNDDDNHDEHRSINAKITFNNVNNAIAQLYSSADDYYIRQYQTVENINLNFNWLQLFVRWMLNNACVTQEK